MALDYIYGAKKIPHYTNSSKFLPTQRDLKGLEARH